MCEAWEGGVRRWESGRIGKEVRKQWAGIWGKGEGEGAVAREEREV